MDVPLAKLVKIATFDPYTLGVLVVALAGSWAMLWWLMRRWTRGRTRERLRLWASSRGLSPTETVPPLLDGTQAMPRVLVGFCSADAFVGRLRTATTPASRSPKSPAAWNVMMVRRGSTQAPRGACALRPTASRVSLIDFYGVGYATPGGALELLSFPSVTVPEAFVVFGSEGADVSPAVALAGQNEVPEDLGLILTPDWVVVDFSSRTLDELELTRAWELAGKLARDLSKR